MYLQRNIGGYWIARYRGVAYFTGTRNISYAIGFALYLNGAPQSFTSN